MTEPENKPSIISLETKFGLAEIDSNEYEFISYKAAIKGIDEYFSSGGWHICCIPSSDLVYRRKKMNSKNAIKVTREQFKQIHNIVCNEWKKELSEKYSDFSVLDELFIKEDEIRFLLENCIDDQEYRIMKILQMSDLKCGDLVLVKDQSNSDWVLRFFSHDNLCFNNQKKSGSTSPWTYIRKLDLNDLPNDLK